MIYPLEVCFLLTIPPLPVSLPNKLHFALLVWPYHFIAKKSLLITLFFVDPLAQIDFIAVFSTNQVITDSFDTQWFLPWALLSFSKILQYNPFLFYPLDRISIIQTISSTCSIDLHDLNWSWLVFAQDQKCISCFALRDDWACQSITSSSLSSIRAFYETIPWPTQLLPQHH